MDGNGTSNTITRFGISGTPNASFVDGLFGVTGEQTSSTDPGFRTVAASLADAVAGGARRPKRKARSCRPCRRQLVCARDAAVVSAGASRRGVIAHVGGWSAGKRMAECHCWAPLDGLGRCPAKAIAGAA